MLTVRGSTGGVVSDAVGSGESDDAADVTVEVTPGEVAVGIVSETSGAQPAVRDSSTRLTRALDHVRVFTTTTTSAMPS